MISDDLVIAYAKNRIELKAVKDEIQKMTAIDDFDMTPLNLQKYYDWYMRNEDGLSQLWDGWVNCLSYADELPTDDECRLAVLMDKRKAILADAGKIKQAICSQGKRIMNAPVLEDS